MAAIKAHNGTQLDGHTLQLALSSKDKKEQKPRKGSRKQPKQTKESTKLVSLIFTFNLQIDLALSGVSQCAL